eukprot:gene21738-28208_t
MAMLPLVILCTFSNAANAAPPTCSSEDGYDYWGYDLGQTKNVSNAAECCTFCDGVPGCKFWTIQLPGAQGVPFCTTKSSNAGRRPASLHSRTSGSRAGGPPVPRHVPARPSFWNSCTFNLTGGARLKDDYCNPDVALQLRVKDLLSKMTYEEKSAALDTGNPPVYRLGIPSLQGGESTHGVATGCGIAGANGTDSTGCPTSFPSGQVPGLGATFNTDVWMAVGQVIGTEARSLNNQALTQGGGYYSAKFGSGGVGGDGDVSDVPALAQGPSGLYFLDPNINLMRD